jgi:hypothetical protein
MWKYLKPMRRQRLAPMPFWFDIVMSIAMILTGVFRLILLPFGYSVEWDFALMAWGFRTFYKNNKFRDRLETKEGT